MPSYITTTERSLDELDDHEIGFVEEYTTYNRPLNNLHHRQDLGKTVIELQLNEFDGLLVGTGPSIKEETRHATYPLQAEKPRLLTVFWANSAEQMTLNILQLSGLQLKKISYATLWAGWLRLTWVIRIGNDDVLEANRANQSGLLISIGNTACSLNT